MTDSPGMGLGLALSLLRRWRAMIGVPLLAAGVAAGLSLVAPERYTARAAFAPEAARQTQLPAGLLGIAGQMGLNLGGSTESPGFYIQVMNGRPVLLEVLMTRYPDPDAPSDSATLLEILETKGDTPEERTDNALRRLRAMVATTADNQTRIVQLNVTSRHPELSAGIANRFVASLTNFNVARAQMVAGDRRRFVEERFKEAAGALAVAEDSLYSFMARNRVMDSPELRYEMERRERQVSIQQELYLNLNRAFEEARIDEVNDVATLTVIEPAVAPSQRSSPRRTVWVVMTFLFAVTATALVVVGLDYVEALKATGPLGGRPQ